MWQVTTTLRSSLNEPDQPWTTDSWKKAHFEDHLGKELLDEFKQIGIRKGYKVDLPASYVLKQDDVGITEMYQTQWFTSESNYHKNSKYTKMWLESEGVGFWPFVVREVNQKEV
tara:strand:- start:1476 stop:1817 length:342 start_codon:yes stop_codon:yes gene_type:complete